MIEYQVEMGEQSELKLERAILCYQGRGTGYLEVRDVRAGENGPELGAGRPATEKLIRSMVYGAEDRTTRFLDPRLLALGPGKAVWFSKPRVRTLFFVPNNKKTKPLTADRMQPALVFMVRSDRLSVRAVKTTRRPTLGTPTFHAPYWNLYETGALCHGSMPAPKGTPSELIDAWEDAFYDSAFTHPCNRPKIVDYKAGVPALWRSLRNAKRFPNERLLPTGQSLEQWIGR